LLWAARSTAAEVQQDRAQSKSKAAVRQKVADAVPGGLLGSLPGRAEKHASDKNKSWISPPHAACEAQQQANRKACSRETRSRQTGCEACGPLDRAARTGAVQAV
jgi:hypothetical protein